MKYALLIGALVLGISSGTANADVLYNLTLTATSDTDSTPLALYSGVGTIDLSSAPSGTGQSNYTNPAVTFLIDGQSFSGIATSARFTNGAFTDVVFSEQIGTNPNRFDLQTNAGYIFYYANEGQDAVGSITATAAPVPEPLTLSLFGAGLAGAAAIRRRRKQSKA